MAVESRAVSLAHTAPFNVGSLRIIPAAREVERGGARESIEPLVMQVLIVLAEDTGSVISRDTLIDRCWSGRAISEDALNRVVAKIRRIATGIGDNAFHVETITKVGYRLRVGDGLGMTLSPATATSMPAGITRRQLALGATGAALAMVPLYFALRSRPNPVFVSSSASAPPVGAASDLETRGLSLLFQGTAEQTDQGIAYLQQATALAPRRATLWGSLAMGYILSLSYVGPASMPAAAARAEEAARKGLALDPAEGRSAAALVSLAPTFRHWLEKDTQLRRAYAHAAPDTPPLMFQRAQFLASVGRTAESLQLTDRLIAISPLLPWIQSLHANLLAASGRPDAAMQAADHASSLWSRDPLTWFTRCDLALYGGRPRDALAMIEERSRWPAGAAADIADRAAIARALISPSSSYPDQLLDRIAVRAATDRTAAETAVQAAAALGKSDRAFALARRMYDQPGVLAGRGVVMPRIGADDGHERNTALLFWIPVGRLSNKLGYSDLLRHLGLNPAAL